MDENSNRQVIPDEQPAISRKKRKALITYLASLLILALVLVVLSMVIENKRLKDSGIEASSALAKAVELQNENRSLTETVANTQRAYDLLLKSKAEQLAGNDEAFTAAMAELAEMLPYLSGDALTEYNTLLALQPSASTN